MQTLNLYQLTRVTDLELFAKYEQQLSKRKTIKEAKEAERLTLNAFVEMLLSTGGAVSDRMKMLSGFYFSFTIPKISKEFDLLRIGSECVVNNELKSESTQEKILKQLRQNRYYLKSLGKPLYLFAFDSAATTLYMLTDRDELNIIGIDAVRDVLLAQTDIWNGDIENLFRASDFLISPLSTPERFLSGEYFLTSQQEEIEKSILNGIAKNKTPYFALTGDPGTGKTLLLYDMAVRLSAQGRCCIVHCGIMPDGLKTLGDLLQDIDIVEAKILKNLSFSFNDYQFILVDESHRVYAYQFERLIKTTKDKQIRLIFSYDEKQVLSESERNAKIAERIVALPGCKVHRLTNKIRTNKELASFIERLRDLHSHNIVSDYSSAEIAYARNNAEAALLLVQYTNNGYTFINYTGSRYYGSSFDVFALFSGGRNTHNVIGQEFENVVMLLDDNFGYDENGKLRARKHPNPDYLYRQLFFQGASRVREKLAIIVLDNPDVFAKALEIITPRE